MTEDFDIPSLPFMTPVTAFKEAKWEDEKTEVIEEKEEVIPPNEVIKQEEKVVEDEESSEEPEVEESKTVYQDDEDPLYKAFNDLFEEEVFIDVPDRFKKVGEDYTYSVEDYKEILTFNVQKAIEKEQENFFKSLSPEVSKIVEYDIRDGEDLTGFIQNLALVEEFKSLNPDLEGDQEKIIKEYYRGSFTPDEISEMIEDFRTSGALSKQAKLLKPKLDAKAEKLAESKLEEQRLLEETEKQRKVDLQKRVYNILQKGKVGEVPITEEIANYLYAAIAGKEEQIIIKGKKITLPYSEALGMYHKFSPKGDLERYMESMLLLNFPDEFRKYYKTVAKNEEIVKQKTQNRFSQQRKAGTVTGVEVNKNNYKPIFTPKINK